MSCLGSKQEQHTDKLKRNTGILKQIGVFFGRETVAPVEGGGSFVREKYVGFVLKKHHDKRLQSDRSDS